MDDPTNTNNAISCKVVLLGESGVGKTSIISRYIHNTFSSNSMSTTGASFASKTMYFEKYDKYVKFEIWDTAGQEKYRSLTKIFYKDASVAIIVYDITRKDSFDEIRKYWMNQLLENASKKIIIAIAANKSDMYDVEEVEESTGRNYAKEINTLFKYTSAKNSTGIEELFRIIGNKFIDPNFEDSSGVPEISHDNLDASQVRRQTVRITRDNTNTTGGKKKGCC